MEAAGWGHQQQQWQEWQHWQQQQQPVQQQGWGDPYYASYAQQQPAQPHAAYYDAGATAAWQPSAEPAGPPAAKRQCLEVDQRALFLQASGQAGSRGRQAAAPRLPPTAPGLTKAERRAANAAAAGSLASLPASATGNYLDAYPAVKRLLQRFK